jgi:hypothetical protein
MTPWSISRFQTNEPSVTASFTSAAVETSNTGPVFVSVPPATTSPSGSSATA